MDANDLRAVFTLVMFILFVAIVLWAFSARNRERFAEAARLPLDDEQPARQGASHEVTGK